MTQLATSAPPGERAARISYEEFLAIPGSVHAEWVHGEVIEMMSVSRRHEQVGGWLFHLLRAFLEEHPMGELYRDPFQMKAGPDLPGRQPDILFVASVHLDRLKEQFLDGPADLVVEIVSPGNQAIDRGDKYTEYEAGGVPEYWIIDPEREAADFFRLNERGVYRPVFVGQDGIYRSTAIPGLWIKVEWFWSLPPVGRTLVKIESASPAAMPPGPTP